MSLTNGIDDTRWTVSGSLSIVKRTHAPLDSQESEI